MQKPNTKVRKFSKDQIPLSDDRRSQAAQDFATDSQGTLIDFLFPSEDYLTFIPDNPSRFFLQQDSIYISSGRFFSRAIG